MALLRLEARGRRADAEAAAGDFDAALADARQAQAAALALAGATISASAPAGVDSPENQLAIAYQRVGDLNRARGDFDDARAAYQAWRDRAAALRAAQPNETLWLRNEMFAIQRLGDLALSGGATSRGGGLFADYLSAPKRSLRPSPPTRSASRRSPAPISASATPRSPPATPRPRSANISRCRTNAERLIGFDSANFRWREFVAVAWQRLGAAELARQDPTTALADFETYRSLSQALVAKDAANAAARYDVANADEKVGDALSALGRLDEARAAYQADEEAMAALVAAHPGNAIWRRSLAISRQRLGEALAEATAPARPSVPRLSRGRRSGGDMGPARPVAARRRPLLPARARGRAVTAPLPTSAVVAAAGLVAAGVRRERRRGRRADAEDENDRRKQDAHGVSVGISPRRQGLLTAVRLEGKSQQLLPLQVLLPPVFVANAGAVAALTPKIRMIAASRMRMAVSPSGIFPRRQGLSAAQGAVKGGFRSRTCPHPGSAG